MAGDGHDELIRLVETVAKFRGEGGCAWYEAQDHRSLVKYLLEECAELVDAIEEGTAADRREELGDVLFQVLFHADVAAQAANASERFDLEAVARDQREKLERRNPHVFGPHPTRDIDEIIALWKAAKAEEKAHRTSVLDGIPTHWDALPRAAKVLSRAADVGAHTDAAVVAGENGQPPYLANEDELGEMLLGLIAAAQARGLSTDRALRRATARLVARVRDAEARSGESPSSTT